MGAAAAALPVSVRAAADRAHLSEPLVEEPPLALDRRTGVAIGGARPRCRTARARHRDGRLRGGTRGVARRTARHPHGAAGAERISGPHHALARAARPAGAPRLSGSARAVAPRPRRDRRAPAARQLGLVAERPTLLVFG